MGQTRQCLNPQAPGAGIDPTIANRYDIACRQGPFDLKPRPQMDFSQPWPKSASGLISSISKVIAA